MKAKLPQDYTHTDDLSWQPFPEAFSEGGVTWKLLNVSPEIGGWTAMFDCPTGSSFARHIHMGPGEYFLMSGVMEVQGGEHAGGMTAVAPAYGYEPCNARHDRTYFVEGGQFYMTFLGPLQFIQDDGTPIAGDQLGAGARPLVRSERPDGSRISIGHPRRCSGSQIWATRPMRFDTVGGRVIVVT